MSRYRRTLINRRLTTAGGRRIQPESVLEISQAFGIAVRRLRAFLRACPAPNAFDVAVAFCRHFDLGRQYYLVRSYIQKHDTKGI